MESLAGIYQERDEARQRADVLHKPVTEPELAGTPDEARPPCTAPSDTTNPRPEIADSIGEDRPSGTGDGCPTVVEFETFPRTGIGDTATAAPTAAERVDEAWPLGTAQCRPTTVSETAIESRCALATDPFCNMVGRFDALSTITSGTDGSS